LELAEIAEASLSGRNFIVFNTVYLSASSLTEQSLSHIVRMAKFGFETTSDEAAAALSKQIKRKTSTCLCHHGPLHSIKSRRSFVKCSPFQAIITGVTPGSLGADAARALVPHEPLLLILASRTIDKINKVIADIEVKSSTIVKPLELDLSSQASVRAAATKVLEWTTSVDAVIETAGVMVVPEYQVNSDGLEMTFAVNHLGHFLFTNLIMERLLLAKDGGVVVPFTSEAHKRATLNLENIGFDVT
jgi:hypothetical protein